MAAKDWTWKSPLSADVECAIGLNVDCGGPAGVRHVRDEVLKAITPHIKAAEQRGFSAASSKLGQTIRDLRYLIKVREES